MRRFWWAEPEAGVECRPFLRRPQNGGLGWREVDAGNRDGPAEDAAGGDTRAGASWMLRGVVVRVGAGAWGRLVEYDHLGGDSDGRGGDGVVVRGCRR